MADDVKPDPETDKFVFVKADDDAELETLFQRLPRCS